MLGIGFWLSSIRFRESGARPGGAPHPGNRGSVVIVEPSITLSVDQFNAVKQNARIAELYHVK
jgi:hypothetical protein